MAIVITSLEEGSNISSTNSTKEVLALYYTDSDLLGKQHSVLFTYEMNKSKRKHLSQNEGSRSCYFFEILLGDKQYFK